MGVENVHEEGQEGTNNLVGCTHYGLPGLPVSRSSGRRLCSHTAASEDTLNGALVE